MANPTEGKEHVSIVICGHVDSGKSTTTGRLIYELGGIDERELEKLKAAADAEGKGSFVFAFYMDVEPEERKRGVTISARVKQFYTATKHFTIIDAPGHRDYIKNMITGTSQADVALILIPADGNFTKSIAKGDAKTGEIPGQTREHARLLALSGIRTVIVGVNKMDEKSVKYAEERFKEVSEEMQNVLKQTGWQKALESNQIPIIPLSGWIGDNLLKQSENMPWWKGIDVLQADGKTKVHINTLVECLDTLVTPPPRNPASPMRMPVSGLLNIKGVGDVVTGRIEQGVVKKNDEVVFLPTHTEANPCSGKVFSIEMHHKTVDEGVPGYNVGVNIKGLNKKNMPHTGDVMVLKKDFGVNAVIPKTFTMQAQILNHPGELKVGYTPIAFVRTARAPVRLKRIVWKIGKDTGNAKMNDPPNIKSKDMCELVFEPQTPFYVEPFKICEGFGRVAVMEGNGCVMLGKVTETEKK
jgi:elongation factor 1-alpha